MLIQIITNYDNGAGLQEDSALLCRVLTDLGHVVRRVHIHRWPAEAKAADLNIFLEVLIPEVMPMAPKNYMVPNSEWWGGHWDHHIPGFTKVLCKTADTLRIWNRKAPGKCALIGWAAKDYYRPEVPRERVFLHTAGKSQTKNTAAVIEAWRRYRLPYPLTVSAFKPEIAGLCMGVKNVRVVSRFSDEDIITEVNRSRFFLMPSKYEGYGHAIHEALGCGAAVITTGAEPMASFSGIDSRLLVKAEVIRPMGAAHCAEVSVQALAQTCKMAAEFPEQVLDALGQQARIGFLKDNAAFHRNIAEVFNGL